MIVSKIKNRLVTSEFSEKILSLSKLVVYSADRWPGLESAIRAVSIALLFYNIRHGLLELLHGGIANMTLGTLVLTLAISCVHAVVLVLEIVMFSSKTDR